MQFSINIFHMKANRRIGDTHFVGDLFIRELLSALNAALKNQRYISPQLSLEVQDAIETPWVKPEGFSSKLTPRQQEVLQLLTKGFSTKEIAATMQVSTKAVEFHKGNITRRLGIRTTAELTRFALSQGLTKLDDQHP